jgi:hypothetical protein
MSVRLPRQVGHDGAGKLGAKIHMTVPLDAEGNHVLDQDDIEQRSMPDLPGVAD